MATVSAALDCSDNFETFEAGPDGWTEWVSPVPSYLMKCCACGLVHKAEFRVVKIVEFATDGTWDAEIVNDPSYRVQFRMRR